MTWWGWRDKEAVTSEVGSLSAEKVTLEHQIEELRTKLKTIETAERFSEYRKLIGRCFKEKVIWTPPEVEYRTRLTVLDPQPYWIYSSVIDADEVGGLAFTFYKAHDNWIRVINENMFRLSNRHIEIGKREVQKAWVEFQKEIVSAAQRGFAAIAKP